MKNTQLITLSFSELSTKENTAIYGGIGFAYDAGRFLRLIVIAAGGMGGPARAIGDAVYVSML